MTGFVAIRGGGLRGSLPYETLCAMYITNNPSQTGYSRSGEQKAGGLFLILFSVKAGGEIRAAVRSVQMRQSGHFMVGEAKLAGIPVFLSGLFGGDGLTKDPPPGIWEQLGEEGPEAHDHEELFAAVVDRRFARWLTLRNNHG